MAETPLSIDPSNISAWKQSRAQVDHRADWLVGGLVGGGVLPYEFRGARVAPVVAGIARPINALDQPTYVHMAMDPRSESLQPAAGGYNPHYGLKRQVGGTLKEATSDIKRGRKARVGFDATLFPGFVFPDVVGGTLLLDSVLTDPDCTEGKVRNIAGQIAKQYGLETIYVGDKLVYPRRGNENVPSIYFSMPTVARMALAGEVQGRRGRNISPKVFSDAAARLMGMQ